MRARDVTNDQIEAFDEPARMAWLDSMDDDERMVVEWPVGWWRDLVMISICKRALTYSMPPELQLRYLKVLERFVSRGHIGVANAALLQPASEATWEIFRKVLTLPAADRADMLGRWEVRWQLIGLEPSYLDAIRAHERGRAVFG